MAQSIWAAAQEYDVTLISFTQGAPAPAPEAWRRLGVDVKTVEHRPPWKPVALVQGLVGKLPYTLSRYRSAAFARVLDECVRARRPAFVLANHLHMAPYVDRLDGVPLVLREHNLEHLWMSRYAEESLKGPARAYAGLQARRLEAAERSFCQAAALTLAIQDLERDALRALAPGAWIETLPVGIDLSRFGQPRTADPPVVLLAGSFAWPPTASGAIRFLTDGWPRVRAAVPSARLRVVGKSQPDDLVQAARAAGADVVPVVPSMADEMSRAAVMVVPLWSGAGARVKIMEALAARLPVAATPIGAEGLGLEPGRHDVETPDAGELGDLTARLLQDPAQRSFLAREGRAYAETHWSHVAVARRQNELVARVVR
ncbi:MAG TPA: glycosyltransferase family 4 protein [Candidatus Eisenbacteria bacterium]|nr:glycosyltransferase family 4 protein [Candidatus Eisenbacteria bacterium]